MTVSRKSYYKDLAVKFGLRLNHHNIGDFKRLARSHDYKHEATTVERILARSDKLTESTFILAFLEAVTEDDLSPEIPRAKIIDPGSVEMKIDGPLRMNFAQLQLEHYGWVQHNFPEQLHDENRALDGFIGTVEELGELAASILKLRQGIRGTKEEWKKKQKDAVGDTVIFLTSFCTSNGLDLQECVEIAWSEVKERDWVKYPKTGMPPKEEPTEEQQWAGCNEKAEAALREAAEFLDIDKKAVDRLMSDPSRGRVYFEANTIRVTNNPFSISDLKNEFGVCSVDGDCACVMVGNDLQDGEAAFSKIYPDEPQYAAFIRARTMLETRLGRKLKGLIGNFDRSVMIQPTA